jgi:hypothetical protein
VRELLGQAAFERREVEWRDSSVADYADFMLETYGPLLNAQEAWKSAAASFGRS